MMKSYFLIWLVIAEIFGSGFALGTDKSTPIVFSSNAENKFKFDTNYSLSFESSGDLLLGVMKQRSLGSFKQTTFTQTDDFADAIAKRLVEYSQISKELRSELEKPLPEIAPPSLKMVNLGTTDSDANVRPSKALWEYTQDSLDQKVSEIEKELQGSNRKVGLKKFLSLFALLEANPGASYLKSARIRMKQLEEINFSNGVLKHHALSDLSVLTDQKLSKSRFIKNILNNCIVELNCNTLPMRILVAHVDLFSATEELPGIGAELEKTGYQLIDLTQALAIVSKLSALESLRTCGATDCKDSKSYYVQILSETYRLDEDIAKICSDNIFKLKEIP